MSIRNVLVASYYFPPSGGPGVQRTLKFVKYLPQFGWTPTILTVRPESAAYPAVDESLVAEVPEGVVVERTKAFDPYSGYAALLGKKREESVGVGLISDKSNPGWRTKLARAVRANLFIPDARVGWVPFARKRARRLAASGEFDAVLTSGPPHSVHFVGEDLRRRYAIPWVMDMRDPWTDVSYYEEFPRTQLARRRDARMERRMLESADHVVTVTDGFRRLFRAKTGTKVTVVNNGFDPDDFLDHVAPDPGKFSIAHVGNLSAVQNPTGLWRALTQLGREPQAPEIEIRFVGNADVSVRESIDDAGLADRTQWKPYLPHKEAIREMMRSSVLLVCVNRVDRGETIVPAKLYEYMATGRPILGVGDPSGDTSAILRESGTGKLFHWDDVAGIAAYLDDVSRAAPVVTRIEEAVQRYSRVEQTKQLVAILDNITG